MIKQVLRKLNLDDKEIEVYLQLLKAGSDRASTIAYQLDLPRTTTQNILIRLEKANIVTKSFEDNVSIFTATHPDDLPQLLETKKQKSIHQLDQAIEDLKKVTPELASMMQTTKSIPNVKFHKGREGIRKVLFDTLTSKTELKDFANVDAMFKHIKDINDEYVAEREKTNITKRSLLLDTPFAHEIYENNKYSPKSHKGYKWIDGALYPFSLEMNIYDGKVSYITYVEDEFVGVIIENEHIYKMHDSMWNMIWDILPEPS